MTKSELLKDVWVRENFGDPCHPTYIDNGFLNGVEYMKGRMGWLDFPGNKPNDGEMVIIHRKDMGNNWEIARYNNYYECWDGANGDDVTYDLDQVDKFFRVPAI